MHKATQGPPLQATARLVALYKNHVPVALWPDATPDDDELIPLIRAHHERLRVSVDIGREAHSWMGAPSVAAAACACLLLDVGIDHKDVLRMLAPFAEDLEPDDPREALRRVMRLHAAAPEEHEDHEALAYMLRAWNLWSSGAETRRLTWRAEDGMPPVARWAVEIPVEI